MPNGEDPRHLRAVKILCPTRMVPRVQQLTKAKFIAQIASSGAGSADISAIVSNWGMAEPIEVQEFGAGYSYTMDLEDGGGSVSGSDTTYYVLCEAVGVSMLGPMVYVDREPYRVTYYTGAGGGTGQDANLDRINQFEWHCQGRNVTGYGHPYLLHKIKAT